VPPIPHPPVPCGPRDLAGWCRWPTASSPDCADLAGDAIVADGPALKPCPSVLVWREVQKYSFGI